MTLHKEAVIIRTSTQQGKHRHRFQAAFACSHCKRLSIGEAWGEVGGRSDAGNGPAMWSSATIEWTPAAVGGREFPDVPDHIASAADEAYRCRSIGALRGAMLVARSVVEATAKDKGILKGMLSQKIDELCSRGFVREFTRDAAHELRYLGNDMAHGDFVEASSAEDCEAVLDVMSEILNEVYQGPARVARMKAKRTAPATVDETELEGDEGEDQGETMVV